MLVTEFLLRACDRYSTKTLVQANSVLFLTIIARAASKTLG
jgi:hypothetical protein